MRIEQVVSRYGNQGFNHSEKHSASRRLSLKGKAYLHGPSDMLSLSPEIINSDHTVEGLVTFMHLITEDAMKEWMQNTFCQACSRDDAIVEKVLLEIF